MKVGPTTRTLFGLVGIGDRAGVGGIGRDRRCAPGIRPRRRGGYRRFCRCRLIHCFGFLFGDDNVTALDRGVLDLP